MFGTAGKGQPCAYTEFGTWTSSKSLLPPRDQTVGWKSITPDVTGRKTVFDLLRLLEEAEES